MIVLLVGLVGLGVLGCLMIVSPPSPSEGRLYGWLNIGLAALAIVAAAILARRWADTRRDLMRRVAELSTVDEVGKAIVQAQLDVDELCKLMYEHASRIVDTTIFHLGLFDGDAYQIKLWMREGKLQPSRTFQLMPGLGLVGWLRESKQPILVTDFEQEIDSLPAQPVYVSDTPPRSAIFVPLLAGDTVIGTLSIQSFRPYAYGQNDLRVLSAMANQAAVAMQKAQLYAQEVRRVRELETIGQVARQVTATLELDELFKRVVHLIRTNFGYYHVAIHTADVERQVVIFQASSSASGHDTQVEVAWGQGLIGWVAENRKPAIVNDVANDPRYCCIDALEETQSELTVPLLLEDDLVGVLDVQSSSSNAFGPDDLFILETLSDQIAIAIQEARLYEAERQQAWFSTALLQVADAMSRLSDMDAVLTNIVRLTPLLAGVDRCAILLWDASEEAFVPAQTYGLVPELRETWDHMFFRLGTMPALDLMRMDKQPVLASASNELLIPAHLAETLDIWEMLLLPLLAQGELLGAMMVDYAGTAHIFERRMINMLAGIANQAAMVIHSARLVQAQQEEAYVSAVLLQVAEAVSGSLDLSETLAAVVRIAPMLVGVEVCAIFLRDQASGVFAPSQQYGLRREAQAGFADIRLGEDTAVVRGLLAGEQFVTVPGLSSSSDVDVDDQSAVLLSLVGADGLLALPLTVMGEVIGFMAVNYGGLRAVAGPSYSAASYATGSAERWVSILTGIASQTSIAIENNRLLKETAEQERLKQELDVARRIQASFLPPCCPEIPGWEVAALWRSARQVGGDFYDFIPLPPVPDASAGPVSHISGVPNSESRIESPKSADRLGLVIADVADKGVPAALFMALSRTLIRTVAIDGRSPSQAIARANDLILADARSGLFVTAIYAILEPSPSGDPAEIPSTGREPGQVTFVNAGHMPLLLVRTADGAATLLRTHGMAMGILSGGEFPEEAISLEPGDILVLYTDGIIEATNSKLEMFGREQLIEVVQEHRDQSAVQLVETISDAIGAFTGDAPQFDDLTLLVAKRTL
ncbi:MAG: GAF domain-containing protein [Anaerolineae bacterium]|nr:GAF domain-containing protein [Anaerolineae bacterium]